MPAPAPDTVAQEILDALAPMLYNDVGDNLATYLTSIANVGIQEVEDYASDDPVTGAIGWSMVIDIDRAPDVALPWLAQFVGVVLDEGLTLAQQRQQIIDAANWKRGTPQALKDAPKPFLTGTKSVIFRERFGGSGKLTVITYTSETAISAKVLAALMAVKPAGIVLNYEVHDGQDFQSLLTNHPTFANVFSSYTTFYGIVSDQPGV